MRSSKSEIFPYLLAASSPTAVGFGIAVSGALVRYPVFAGQALRYGIGALLLGLYSRRTLHLLKELKASELARLLALSVTGLAGFSVCSIEALRSSSPAAVGVIIGCLPIVLALIVPILSRRRPRPVVFLAAVVVSAGVALVNGGGNASTQGVIWAIGALIGDACFSIIGVSLLKRLGSGALAFWATLFATVGLMVFGTLLQGRAAIKIPTASETLALLYSGVAISFYAVGSWYRALRKIPVDRAGLFTGLIPVAALIGQVVLRIDGINLREVLGVSIVTAGISAGIAFGHTATGNSPSDQGTLEPEF